VTHVGGQSIAIHSYPLLCVAVLWRLKAMQTLPMKHEKKADIGIEPLQAPL
jgi:hypothetical protein